MITQTLEDLHSSHICCASCPSAGFDELNHGRHDYSDDFSSNKANTVSNTQLVCPREEGDIIRYANKVV